MISMGGPINGWLPRVVRTIATTGDGIQALSEAIDQHADHIRNSAFTHDRMEKARRELLEATRRYFEDIELEEIGSSVKFKRAVIQIAKRRTDPYKAARALLRER